MTRRTVEQAAMVLLLALMSCYWAFLRIEPRPTTLEDFSVVLAADTYSHGRLANPAHPLTAFFERPFQLNHPNYVSVSTPLPGLVLLLGDCLGNPLYGSILTYALACVAVWWMLIAVRELDPVSALMAAMALATHPNLVSHWGIGYTGASLGVLGAALVYGAVFRLRVEPRPAAAWALGVGFTTLVLSWPFEGLVACIPAAWVLLRELISKRSTGPSNLLSRNLIPAVLLILATIAFTGYFNWRTTGDSLKSPRSLYDETYASVPDLLLQERGPEKNYNGNITLEVLYSEPARFTKPYVGRQNLAGFLQGLIEKTEMYAGFLLPLPLPLLLLGLPWCLRNPDVRFACASVLLFAATLAVQTFEREEFLGPFVPLALVALVSSVARIGRIWSGPVPIGLIVIVCTVGWTWKSMLEQFDDFSMELQMRPTYERSYLESIALTNPGQHLILAQYNLGHSVEYDWTRNDADIDSSRIVWALELGNEENEEIARYFPEHTLWSLASGTNGVKMVPHPKTAEIRSAAAREPANETIGSDGEAH